MNFTFRFVYYICFHCGQNDIEINERKSSKNGKHSFFLSLIYWNCRLQPKLYYSVRSSLSIKWPYFFFWLFFSLFHSLCLVCTRLIVNLILFNVTNHQNLCRKCARAHYFSVVYWWKQIVNTNCVRFAYYNSKQICLFYFVVPQTLWLLCTSWTISFD